MELEPCSFLELAFSPEIRLLSICINGPLWTVESLDLYDKLLAVDGGAALYLRSSLQIDS